MTRPLFHLTPERGFLGDPNGVIHLDGRHHLYYQWNPVAAAFGRMHWGHAVSTDLLRWQHRPAALTPGSVDQQDAAGCWSGGAARAVDGTTDFFYTAVADGDHAAQRPRLARPTDASLDVLRPEAVLATPPEQRIHDFRDPFVWWDGASRRMILAAVLPGTGPALLTYTETALGWDFDAVLGHDVLGAVPGRLWECPSVVELDGRWVLMLSVVEGEGADESFSAWAVTLDQAPGPRARPLWVGRLDAGDRYYAALPWQHGDGRWLHVGWLRTQDDPASGDLDWTGAMSLPRELALVGDRVLLRPAAEVNALVRTPLLAVAEGDPGAGRELEDRRLDLDGESALEIVLETASSGGLLLTGAAGELQVPVGDLVDGRGQVRVIVDTGLVESFGPEGARSDSSWLVANLLGATATGDATIVEASTLRLPSVASG
ncbi:MAG TPA: glycoside hydrolase family 32 protein [Propionicimonas sp.]|nr:glycoside hydrolase family 32 protein [Propionicimonas sp.]HRA06596.1 glycoside hydrolase family 32 protein [Propionicimonas sp.]